MNCLRPMAATLNALIDFGRLNDGDKRVSFVAIDMEAGEEVWFDNTEMRITVEHLLACTALAPLFPPVEIDGRLLCDAGIANNLPFDRMFRDVPLGEVGEGPNRTSAGKRHGAHFKDCAGISFNWNAAR